MWCKFGYILNRKTVCCEADWNLHSCMDSRPVSSCTELQFNNYSYCNSNIIKQKLDIRPKRNSSAWFVYWKQLQPRLWLIKDMWEMKKIIIALLIVAMSASVLSADPPQIIDFEILKIAGNSINYFFRYKLMNDSSVSVDLSDNDEIVIGNFQTDNKGVKAGSVLFDIMDCSNIVQAVTTR